MVLQWFETYLVGRHRYVRTGSSASSPALTVGGVPQGSVLVLSRLDHENATLAGIPLYQLKPLQSVINSAARLVFPSSRYAPITPLLHGLHWLKAAERIDYKLALLVYKCRQGAAPSYLADELCKPADFEARCRLRSASSSSVVRGYHLTLEDRDFTVAAVRVWKSLPQHVTSAQSLPVFCSRLKTHLFRRCFPWLCCCAWEVALLFLDTLIILLTYLHGWKCKNPFMGQTGVTNNKLMTTEHRDL